MYRILTIAAVLLAMVVVGCNTDPTGPKEQGTGDINGTSYSSTHDSVVNLPIILTDSTPSMHDSIDRKSPESAALASKRVTYSTRYLIYDTNHGDYDYIYVFRLPISYVPGWIRLYYAPRYLCWPIQPWSLGADVRRVYFSGGSLVIEALIGKGRVDAFTCYGYFELEYQ